MGRRLLITWSVTEMFSHEFDVADDPRAADFVIGDSGDALLPEYEDCAYDGTSDREIVSIEEVN